MKGENGPSPTRRIWSVGRKEIVGFGWGDGWKGGWGGEVVREE